MSDVIVLGTGHRTAQLVPKNPYDPRVLVRLTDLCKWQLKELKPTKVISGMALGFDTALAAAAIFLQIPLIAAVPHIDQFRFWTPHQQRMWKILINQAAEVHIVPEGPYHLGVNPIRNIWMLDRGTHVLALYNGRGKGGTHHCITQAAKRGLPIHNCWQDWVDYSGFF